MLSSENVIHVLKVFLTNCLLNILLFSSMFYKKQNIFHSLRLTSNHILMKACCKKLRKCINYRLWWKMEASRQIRKNGNKIIGRKSNLLNHLIAGNDIRFSLNNRSLKFLVQSATLVGDEIVWVQSLFNIDKSEYIIFKSNVDWMFINRCTNEHVHLSRWSGGAHSDRGQTKTTLIIILSC